MSGTEPFLHGDDDRTMLVPQPGGRISSDPASLPAKELPASGVVSSSPRAIDPASVKLSGRGLNPIVRAATHLLDLVMPLRTMTGHTNLEELRQQLVHVIKNFEHELRSHRIDAEQIAAGRYVLCTFLDETISSTPWGGDGAWATKSLLVHFHNEAWGGEKVFIILQRLSQDPKSNLHVLELIYLCLALGLEGRYRVREGGRDQLETLRERLSRMIQLQRGSYERELSPHWKGVTDQRNSVLGGIPVWIFAVAVGAIIVGIHFRLNFLLNRALDPVSETLRQVHVNTPKSTASIPVTPLSPTPVLRLSEFLKNDLAQGLVSVVEMPDRSIVTLRGDGVFASGSSEILQDSKALIGRIGDALSKLAGRVTVVGHTDDLRISSPRFPSNLELSKARADSVLKELASRAEPESRYTVIGRGAMEPLVPNNSALNRARNRRVDIILLNSVAQQ